MANKIFFKCKQFIFKVIVLFNVFYTKVTADTLVGRVTD
jgi:hypothetical protein